MLRADFGHGRWWIRWVPAGERKCLPDGQAGSCDPVEKKGRRWIYLRAGEPAAEELETTIHELLHAWAPQFSEETVEEGGRVIAGILTRLGYRRMRSDE